MIHLPHLARGIARFNAVLNGGNVPDLPRPVHLIAEAPVLDVVGLVVPMGAAQITPLGPLIDIAVLEQRERCLRGASAKVGADERLCTHGVAPCHILVDAELVGLDTIPGPVEHPGAIFLRSHAIQPVVP